MTFFKQQIVNFTINLNFVRKTTALLILTLCCSLATAQTRFSVYERRWALLHPVAALKAKRIVKVCNRVVAALVATGKAPRDFKNGGREDAFRHMFYMAAFAQKIKPHKVLALGRAHEKGNYRQFITNGTEDGERPDSLGCAMDLHNNAEGVLLGRAHKMESPEELAEMVIAHLQAGKALVVMRRKDGAYLNCNGDVIEPGRYKGKWHVPKCLVPSNYEVPD